MTTTDKQENTQVSAFQKQVLRSHSELQLPVIEAVIRLHKMGIPTPSITRYHRDEVQGISEQVIYSILDEKEKIEEIEKQQQHIIREIRAQNQLTPELESRILNTYNLSVLDDIFLPLKLKGRTTATVAKEAGLQDLADWIWQIGHDAIDPGTVSLEEKAKEFCKADTNFHDVESVLNGAVNILVEKIAETAELRAQVRQSILRKSKIRCQKGPKAKEKSKYARFFDYREPIGSLKKTASSQRYLIMRKGWAAGELVLSFERADEGILTELFENYACTKRECIAKDILFKSAHLALNGNVFTGIEHDTHKQLKENAEDNLISYFCKSLRKRLLQAPFGNLPILGIDPGPEQKPASLALVNEKGDLLVQSNFSLENDADWEKFRPELEQSLEKIHISAVAILHGPKGKTARRHIGDLLKNKNISSPLVMIYEQAAAIYSTSSVSKEELPDIDPGARRACFTARFLQNPLRELVKVDPKFLATGAFQFDIHPSKLGKALYRTIQSCVCTVGVDINTGSRSAFAYLPGLDHNIAKALVSFRTQRGKFNRIEDIKLVPEVTDKIFEQSLGYLRLADSKNLLDRTGILPAQFNIIGECLTNLGCDLQNLTPEKLVEFASHPFCVEKLGILGAKAAAESLSALIQDPRGSYKEFRYGMEKQSLAEIKPDQAVSGIITNITNFGAFVDVGLEQDGLIHISEFTEQANPYEELAIGDEVNVWIQNVNTEKNQLSLSLKSPEERKRRFSPRGKPRGRREGPRNAVATGTDDGSSRERRFKRRPPRPSRDDQAPGEIAPSAVTNNMEGRERSSERPHRHDRKDSNRDRDRAPTKPPEKKRPPQRDPKTGAVMKLDDSVYTSEKKNKSAQRFATKAKVATYNPFAKLNDMLKNKNES